ncbi:MAG TPA: hypothetical protein VFT56_09715 [Sphingomonas sp.]|nr:hypothetical protein [Sphingomonas sp.]
MRVTAAMAALLLAGCRGAQPANETATPSPAPRPNSIAVPLPQASATPAASLGRYAGHYPFDAIDGVRFLGQPAVTHAVAALVPDAAIRAQVLGGDGPAAPIALKNGKLLAWGCRTHDCGDHNWTVAITPDGSDSVVCYHDAPTMQARSRWYVAPSRTEMRDGDCPSD